jgi:hypothetical protein
MNGRDTMTPPPWSYATPRGAADRRRPARRWILLAAVAVLAATGLLIWLALPPTVTHPSHAGDSYARKPSLADLPPTVFINALHPRSLYPPGYVDFDMSQGKQQLSPEDIHYVPGADYTLSSSPPGCEHNPLSDTKIDTTDTDPERYRGYPVLFIMYPVDDPGGNKGDNGFFLNVFPANDPKGLDKFRDYFKRCQGALISLTVTKDGQVVYQHTDPDPIDNVILDAPSSAAEDSFLEGPTKDSQTYEYVGLIRGMVVTVQCPVTQKDAGLQLFRTTLLRIWDMQR